MMEESDNYFMELALQEARIGYQRGNFPVGAVMTVNGELAGRGGNSMGENNNWTDHAETSVIRNNSELVKKAAKSGQSVHLYTTLEPCLMCLGTSVVNRVSRIVYACDDPYGGSAGLDKNSLPNFYVNHWPVIEKGSFERESYDLVLSYMMDHVSSWREILVKFEEMRMRVCR
jgi:tRNA(adenine34) deaminase